MREIVFCYKSSPRFFAAFLPLFRLNDNICERHRLQKMTHTLNVNARYSFHVCLSYFASTVKFSQFCEVFILNKKVHANDIFIV